MKRSGLPPVIRAMQPRDVEKLDALLRAAYGSTTSFAPRLRLYLEQRTATTFVAFDRGRPIGMVIGNDYGRTGYISLMGVDPAEQGRGLGRRLMQELVEWADPRGFGDLQLDATDAGAPLYERFFFLDDGETHVYLGRGGGEPDPRARPATVADTDAILACDRAGFGADRNEMLRILLAQPDSDAFVIAAEPARGYVIAQSGQIGPWFARDREDAEALLVSAMAAREGAEVRLCLDAEAETGVALARAHGFSFSRSLRHMTRGARRPRPLLLGRANLGQG